MLLGPTLGFLDGEHGFSALGVHAVLDVGFKGKLMLNYSRRVE